MDLVWVMMMMMIGVAMGLHRLLKRSTVVVQMAMEEEMQTRGALNRMHLTQHLQMRGEEAIRLVMMGRVMQQQQQ